MSLYDELQKCRAESQREGEARGLKEGEARGMERKVKEMAISLAKQGVAIEVIAKSAKVSMDSVERWLLGERKEERKYG